jgi:hypothetical protein
MAMTPHDPNTELNRVRSKLARRYSQRKIWAKGETPDWFTREIRDLESQCAQLEGAGTQPSSSSPISYDRVKLRDILDRYFPDHELGICLFEFEAALERVGIPIQGLRPNMGLIHQLQCQHVVEWAERRPGACDVLIEVVCSRFPHLASELK